jgi:hypothetical protein
MTAKRPEQLVADAAEADAAKRYVRQRQFVGLLGEAIARADAMSRLEAALRLQPRGH